jgi:hypothetical protein
LGLEDIGPKLVARSRQVQFGAAEGALDLRAHCRDREMIVSHLLHGWDRRFQGAGEVVEEARASVIAISRSESISSMIY